MTEKVELSLNDIALCLLVIDTVSQRGAIRGDEMADVGALRNRLKAFLDSMKPAEEPEQAE